MIVTTFCMHGFINYCMILLSYLGVTGWMAIILIVYVFSLFRVEEKENGGVPMGEWGNLLLLARFHLGASAQVLDSRP